MNKLCETKPNSETPEMNVTSNRITSYQSPVTIYHYEKQSQTNPILKGAQVKDKYDLKIHLFGINYPIYSELVESIVVRGLFD